MPDAAAPKTTDVRRFACPGCGATLIYAAGIAKLRCEYCDTEQEVPKEGTAPTERALEELLSGKSERGWGAETVTFDCKSCGASVTLPPNQAAGRCPFCDNDVVVQRPSDPNLIRPESLIPFKVDKNAAANEFRDWLGKLWFRPNNLKRMAWLSDIKGVYSPYWTFDAQAQSRWTAESGYYYYTTETYTDSEGKEQSRQVQHTRWEPSSGWHQDFHNDVLICASSLVEELVGGLEPFNTTTALVPYRPEYLSGWMAEEYKVGPADGWKRGEGRIMRREYDACHAQVPGDTQRNLNVSTRLDKITWKHVLLPVWIA
ncbi:MAG: zinc ribbon domain-containing protein, partial [Armatimonadetes bacterium]|nr:zinc ribbon domain-containing protein [Armatimonadota bacterium]